MVENELILRKYKVSGKLRRTSGVIKPPYNGARDATRVFGIPVQ
jgi:hypothetical protein